MNDAGKLRTRERATLGRTVVHHYKLLDIGHHHNSPQGQGGCKGDGKSTAFDDSV